MSSSRTTVSRGANSKASSSTLRRIEGEMMALEGLFRKIGTATPRDRDSVIHQIVALRTPRDAADDKALDTLWFQHLHAAATGAEPQRDGGDAPWTTQVIKAIIRCSCDMQNDPCCKRIVGNIVEWCDTPITRKPGFSTTDGCWYFAEPDRASPVGPRCAASRCLTPLPTLCWRRTKGGSLSSCARRSSMHQLWSVSSLLCALPCAGRSSCVPS